MNTPEDQKLCNTCGRFAASPYRRWDAYGSVTEGCVDDFHSGHLVTPSESARWHYRMEAKTIRRQRSNALRKGHSFDTV